MRVPLGAKLSFLVCFSAGILWASRPSHAAPGTPIGPPGGATRSLAVDPRDPRILYAGTAGGGVYKSVDGGASWKPASRGLFDHRIMALAIDPQTPRTLYAAAGALPSVSGVFKSTDGGASWVPASLGLPSPPPFCGCGSLLTVRALAVGRNGVVFAGGSGVSRSVDKAGHWSLVTGGITIGVGALAVDPSNPRTVYASSSGGLYKTRDGGASWDLAAIDAGPPEAQALVIDPRRPGTVYAGTASGVFKSIDGGAHWKAARRGLGSAAVLAFAVQAGTGTGPSVLFIGTSLGVFKSVDGGGQWTPVNNGLQGFAIGALAAHPKTAGVLWAGAAQGQLDGAGLFKTANAGGLWRVSNHGFFAARVRSLAVDPLDRRAVFAGSDSRGVLHTLDGGVTWTEADRGLTRRSVQALALDAGSQALYAGTPGGVFKSTDRGSSWEPENVGLRDPVTAEIAAVEALAFDPRDAETLYAAGGSGLYVSHDGAATWGRLAVPQLRGDRAVHGVAVDPVRSSLLLAGHAAGILRSVDGGATWSHPSLPFGEARISSFAFDSRQPDLVYAAGPRGAVRSENGGLTWSATGLERASMDLAVDGQGAVYAATELGVYRSTDGGASWLPFANAMVAANHLVLLSGRLYAAIDGGGVQTAPLAP